MADIIEAGPLWWDYRHGVLVFSAFLFAQVLSRVSATMYENLHLDALYMRFFSSFLQFFVLFSSTLMVARFCGVKTEDLWTELLTGGSVIVGLASQDVLSNFAHGLVLILTRPFEVGDNISVAGVNGNVTAVSFFQTTIVTSNNEGLSVPNSAVLGGALQNNTANYAKKDGTPNLREVDIGIHLPVNTTDLEQAITVLEKAGKDLDIWIMKQVKDEQMRKYPTGTSTLKGHFWARHQADLEQVTKQNPTVVFVGGQREKDGHYLEIRAYCDQTMYWDTFQKGYRLAVKALADNGIKMLGKQL